MSNLTQYTKSEPDEVGDDGAVRVYGWGGVHGEGELREEHHIHEVAAQVAGKKKSNKKWGGREMRFIQLIGEEKEE